MMSLFSFSDNWNRINGISFQYPENARLNQGLEIPGMAVCFQTDVKRETKQKMMPFYQNPPDISVDEAKTRIEKPYRGGD